MNLIERDNFLALLHNRFNDIASAEGHSFFITGEAGIGKTSLVKAFLKQVEDKSIQYVGACDSMFTPRPLAPLYDLALQINEEWVDKIQSISSRAELFTRFMHELSRKNRVIVLVFEDIHWADEATLDFIKFFSRRISRTKCLFILTYRDDEINQQHPLRIMVGELSPDAFSRIQLTALSRHAVYKLADEKGYDAENVYSVSGGNPFYVNEILASYSTGIPENIRDAVLSIYNRQQDATKNVWQFLSVIPEGLELNRLAKIDESWHEAIDDSLAKKILVIKSNKFFFKHELYRRTIESALSPFKRLTLNKNLLELFLEIFEEEGDIERIVHYAKNADERKLVVKYAPSAAKKAALVGAHIEASKLYLTAIEHTEENNLDQLVKLYEAFTYECYLTNQINEAITYQAKALKIWQDKNEIEQVGNSQRFLSRLWWYAGNRDEAERFGEQAVRTLETQPSSRTKAMAFSNMSQLKMLSDETAQCVEWGSRAIEMAKELKDDEILCHALNNVGTVQWKSPLLKEKSYKLILESLDIALKHSFHEHAARAYTNISARCVTSKEYNLAKQFLHEGLSYCEERDLDSWAKYKLSWKSRMLVETGAWKEAVIIAEKLLENTRQPAIIKIGALTNLSTIKMRRGEAAALSYLQEAKTLAFITREHQRIIPVMIACFEYEWLTAAQIITDEELKVGIELAKNLPNVYMNSEFAIWLQRARKHEIDFPEWYEPYKLLRKGKASLAADFWHKIGCEYERAFALFEGNEDDKRNALTILQQLGAEAIYKKLKMEMRSSGIKKIPRGLRESTKSNPAQLTNREIEVIHLLKKGDQSKQIAQTLFISTKTVDHHISSILFKLDVNSRSKAVAAAMRLGVIK